MWIISVLVIIPTCPSCLCVARILETSGTIQASSHGPAPLHAPVDNILLAVSPLGVHLFVVRVVVVSPGLLVNTKPTTIVLYRRAGAGHEEGVRVQRNMGPWVLPLGGPIFVIDKVHSFIGRNTLLPAIREWAQEVIFCLSLLVLLGFILRRIDSDRILLLDLKAPWLMVSSPDLL